MMIVQRFAVRSPGTKGTAAATASAAVAAVARTRPALSPSRPYYSSVARQLLRNIRGQIMCVHTDSSSNSNRSSSRRRLSTCASSATPLRETTLLATVPAPAVNIQSRSIRTSYSKGGTAAPALSITRERTATAAIVGTPAVASGSAVRYICSNLANRSPTDETGDASASGGPGEGIGSTLRFESIVEGKAMPPEQFRGKAVLVVNTASLCG